MNQPKLSLPQKIQKILVDYRISEVIKGRLGDDILKLEKDPHQVIYLKSGSGISAQSLEKEMRSLSWLSNKNITIPQIIDFTQDENRTYLTITAVEGLPSYKLKDKMDKSVILKIVAEAIRKFHQINLSGSEQLNSLENDLEKIEKRLKLGVINIDPFKLNNQGKTPDEIFKYLISRKNMFDNNSLTHGDFCLPNILIDENNYGFIDLGDCGPGDKYKDLSAMEVSIKRNFGAELIEQFNKYYDENMTIDREKIKYYQLIDQFEYNLNIEKYNNLPVR